MPLVPPPPPSDTNGSSGFKMKIGKKKKMKNKNNHSENHDIIPPTMSYEDPKESRLPKAYMDTGKFFIKTRCVSGLRPSLARLRYGWQCSGITLNLILGVLNILL